jgi:hypothetical protein
VQVRRPVLSTLDVRQDCGLDGAVMQANDFDADSSATHATPYIMSTTVRSATTDTLSETRAVFAIS